MQGVHSVIPDRNIPNVPKKNTKFSTLIKSGEDSFLLGTRIMAVPENEKVFIEETDGRCKWVQTGERYNCIVTSPKKESKLKGLKTYIAYQLTPTVIVVCLPEFLAQVIDKENKKTYIHFFRRCENDIFTHSSCA